MVGDILQPTHLLFVLVVALLVLGPKRLPEVARTLGKGIRDFRGAISGEMDRDEEPRGILPRDGAPGHYEATEPAPPAAAAAPAPPPAESTAVPTAPVAPAQAAQPVQPAPAPPPAADAVSTAEPAHPEQAPAPAHDAGHGSGGDAEHSAAAAPAHHSE